MAEPSSRKGSFAGFTAQNGLIESYQGVDFLTSYELDSKISTSVIPAVVQQPCYDDCVNDCPIA